MTSDNLGGIIFWRGGIEMMNRFEIRQLGRDNLEYSQPWNKTYVREVCLEEKRISIRSVLTSWQEARLIGSSTAISANRNTEWFAFGTCLFFLRKDSECCFSKKVILQALLCEYWKIILSVCNFYNASITENRTYKEHTA